MRVCVREWSVVDAPASGAVFDAPGDALRAARSRVGRASVRPFCASSVAWARRVRIGPTGSVLDGARVGTPRIEAAFGLVQIVRTMTRSLCSERAVKPLAQSQCCSAARVSPSVSHRTPYLLGFAGELLDALGAGWRTGSDQPEFRRNSCRRSSTGIVADTIIWPSPLNRVGGKRMFRRPHRPSRRRAGARSRACGARSEPRPSARWPTCGCCRRPRRRRASARGHDARPA